MVRTLLSEIEATIFRLMLYSTGRKSQRVVQYRQQGDMWHYIGGGRQLPGTPNQAAVYATSLIWCFLAAQWSSWLSHTRASPPTLQVDLSVSVMADT